MRSKFIYAALGAGVGALVTWAVTSDIYEERIKEERLGWEDLTKDKTEHIFALKSQVNYLERLVSRTADPIETISSKNITLVETESIDLNQEKLDFDNLEAWVVGPEPEEENVVPEGETLEETRSNLQNLIDQYTADEDAQSAFVDNVLASQSYEQHPPFVISREEFAYGENTDEYDKLTLSYFPRDRVLLDDDDEVMENIVQLVGWKNLNQFGGESGDPDVVFVRNEKLMTDFEIVKNDEAQLPLHVQYGMEKEEFRANKAAGTLKLRQEDE